MASLALQFFVVSLANFVYIAAKAFQQLNVVYNYRRLVPFFSFIMVLCEIVLIGNIAWEVSDMSWKGVALTIAAMTFGASAGALSAMGAHRYMRKKGKKDEEI